MKAKRGFPKDIVAAIRDGKILGIRAGTKPHRIIGIWAKGNFGLRISNCEFENRETLPHSRATAPDPQIAQTTQIRLGKEVCSAAPTFGL